MNNKQYPWPTVRLAGLCDVIGLSKDWAEEFRKQRPEGIYWHRIGNSVRVLYNLNLIRDWLANGDSPAHQKAVEKYLASLPSSDAA